MKTQEIYDLVLTELNREGSNQNIELEKGSFVQLFNKHLFLWFGEKLDLVDKTSENENVQQYLVPDKVLSFSGVGHGYMKYSLPDDMYDRKRNTAFCFAKKGSCTKKIFIDTIHYRNQNVVLSNTDLQPSFEWEETFAIFANDELNVYTNNDFTIDNVFLSYYREPKKINLPFIDSLGIEQTLQHTDLQDVFVYTVIDRLVHEVLANRSDNAGYQMTRERIVTQ